MTIRPDPAKIVVPRRHGEILIEPPLPELEAALAHAAPSPLLTETRRTARAHLLAAATRWSRTIGADAPPADALDRPFILTGHQLEFYHPGVWAKVIIADELAQRTGAAAFDLLVDHDTVDHLGFDVPVQSPEGDWSKRPVEFAPPSSLPADSLHAPSVGQFEQWDSALAQYPTTHTDAMAFWLTALKPQSAMGNATSAISYVSWLSRARRQYEASLNIQVHHVPTSLLCTGPLWQHFVQAWITNASAWTAAYNRHLADYRREHRLKNPNRPMPDLATQTTGDTTAIELPFWIYRLGHARERLTLHITGGTAKILRDGAALDPEFVLRDSSLVIRPRALTLTLFARLLFADLFIHGIGGALYDQITDRLLNELFHSVPPYACVSAAWLLPLGQPTDPEDLPALAHRRHHLEHNPQLAIDAFTARKADVAQLLADRQALISQIAASLAAARRNRAEKLRRRALFKQLHATNADLHTRAPNVLGNLDHQLTTARRAAAQNGILEHREFFLGLHTTASLEKLSRLLRG
ncbi:MAG TPA: hypothetical protein VH253_03620 [Phycisphaerae bacterium]|nr:hypothetical protein [Phycisphaerae bacterium]